MRGTRSLNLIFHTRFSGKTLTCLSFFRVTVGMCSGDTCISGVYERWRRSQRRSEAIGSVHLDMSHSWYSRSGCRCLAVYKTPLLYTPQWSLLYFACFLPKLFHSSFHMFSYENPEVNIPTLLNSLCGGQRFRMKPTVLLLKSNSKRSCDTHVVLRRHTRLSMTSPNTIPRAVGVSPLEWDFDTYPCVVMELRSRSCLCCLHYHTLLFSQFPTVTHSPLPFPSSCLPAAQDVLFCACRHISYPSSIPPRSSWIPPPLSSSPFNSFCQ